MNITLNLLPDAQKKILRRRKVFRLALEQQLYLFLIIIFLLGGLVGTHMILLSEVQILERAVASQQKEQFRSQVTDAHALFAQTNADMRNLYVINKSHITWTPILRLVSAVVNDRVRIDKLQIDNTQITMSGVAQTRVDAVTFKQNIAEVERDGMLCFGDVTIPAEDLVAANLTTFKLQATIMQACIMLDVETSMVPGEQPEQQEAGESPAEDVDENVDNS